MHQQLDEPIKKAQKDAEFDVAVAEAAALVVQAKLAERAAADIEAKARVRTAERAVADAVLMSLVLVLVVEGVAVGGWLVYSALEMRRDSC